jgi:hypothetical protein
VSYGTGFVNLCARNVEKRRGKFVDPGRKFWSVLATTDVVAKFTSEISIA